MSHLLNEMKAAYIDLAMQVSDPVPVGLVRQDDKIIAPERPVESFRKILLDAGEKTLSPEEYAELKDFLPTECIIIPKTRLEIRERTRFGECAHTI